MFVSGQCSNTLSCVTGEIEPSRFSLISNVAPTPEPVKVIVGGAVYPTPALIIVIPTT